MQNEEPIQTVQKSYACLGVGMVLFIRWPTNCLIMKIVHRSTIMVGALNYQSQDIEHWQNIGYNNKTIKMAEDFEIKHGLTFEILSKF